LNAAVNGDRLLITPDIYEESGILISKQVELVSAVRGVRYTITRPVTVQAAYGRTVSIQGADVHATLNSSPIGTGSTGCAINLIDCAFDHIDLAYSGIFLTAFRCTVRGQLGFSQGDIAGCAILGHPDLVQPQHSPFLYMGQTTAEASRAIGNIIGSTTWEGSQCMVLLDAHAPLLFANNLVHWTRNLPSASAVTLVGNTVDGITTAGMELRNNTIMRTNGTTQPWLVEGVPDSFPFTAMLTNNLVVGGAAFTVPTGTANLFSDTFNTLTMDFASYNANTGQPLPGSLAMDAGDPDVAHLDLDLSRNDAGCWGGSFSHANFQPAPDSGALVGLVTAPRRFGQLTPMSFTATGSDR
ncbi:MAG TPA: hypothetical protein P5291_10915, partial [Flavobacteriales bacterium]|nr:hypothetical protein [Flavobacteriales bacterium]